MTTQLLLVEDNSQLAGSLGDYLSEVGFEVDFAFNGQSCLTLVEQNHYDVIVMDIMMPSLDGLSACRQLRETLRCEAPIIFLTARGELADKLEGYQAGGDDYLVKPFAPEELVCRLHSLLKRQRRDEGLQVQKLGPITLDHARQRVEREGVWIDMHEVPFQILQKLAQAAPQPVSRAQLERSLWPDGLPESDPLRTHIYRLRSQLDKPFDTALVLTVHGRGYRLAIPD